MFFKVGGSYTWSQFWEPTLWVIASGVCFKNVQHPLPWLHVTLIGGRPGAPPYPQVFRRLGREGAALLVLFVEDTSTPQPLKRHRLTKKYWCCSNALTSLCKVSVRKTNVFSNIRSDFFSKHPEVIHQTQVTLMGKTTFLHKQFIKNGERISKSINNSRAPSIRILRGPWTARINRRVELVLTGPCYMKSKIHILLKNYSSTWLKYQQC